MHIIIRQRSLQANHILRNESSLLNIAFYFFVITTFLTDNEEQEILNLPLFIFRHYRDKELKEVDEKVRVLINHKDY